MVADSYIKLSLDIPQDTYDRMIAVLSGIGFYAFEEGSNLEAYITEDDFNEVRLNQTIDQYFPEMYFSRQVERILSQDWNAEWEKNFEAVRVRDFCEVRPPFRTPTAGMRHDIVVAPKMAFGTGHHATTWLMIDQCAQLDFEGKRVLDMGCGTGVLGILARKCGAAQVDAVDIDRWSFENAQENASLNAISDLRVVQGDASAIPGDCYDILLANINRNVLIADRDQYIDRLQAGGTLVLSGIYDFDESQLAAHYKTAGLKLIRRAERDTWVLLAFRK